MTSPLEKRRGIVAACEAEIAAIEARAMAGRAAPDDARRIVELRRSIKAYGPAPRDPSRAIR